MSAFIVLGKIENKLSFMVALLMKILSKLSLAFPLKHKLKIWKHYVGVRMTRGKLHVADLYQIDVMGE
jgi:hypothetical protein